MFLKPRKSDLSNFLSLVEDYHRILESDTFLKYSHYVSSVLKQDLHRCFRPGIGPRRRDHLDPAPDISTDMD